MANYIGYNAKAFVHALDKTCSSSLASAFLTFEQKSETAANGTAMNDEKIIYENAYEYTFDISHFLPEEVTVRLLEETRTLVVKAIHRVEELTRIAISIEHLEEDTALETMQQRFGKGKLNILFQRRSDMNVVAEIEDDCWDLLIWR